MTNQEGKTLPLTGNMPIGGRTVRGSGAAIHAHNATTGERLEPAFGAATAADLEAACTLAQQAFRPYRLAPLARRAEFLEAIAKNIEGLGDELIERAMQETGLPRGRLEGERGRTVGQLRMFADVIRDGGFLDARIDPEVADRKPARRPDLREQHIGLGPVAVFGASNFPLAFSIAGGDTASAFAAGCPVVAKAHPAHPGTSELVGQAVQAAVRQMQLPEGVFSMLFDSGFAIGAALVAAPQIKAVGFTGSRQGGMALFKIAREREEPIPLYAEMSSINPVILLPNALKQRGAAIAAEFVSSLTLGAGQFCTNPGLVFALETPEVDAFVAEAAAALSSVAAAPMLTAGIKSAFVEGVSRLSGHHAVQKVASGIPNAPCRRRPLFATSADSFRRHPELAEEVFGAASLMVRCKTVDELLAALDALEGQLTAAIHMTDADSELAAKLMPVLEGKSGPHSGQRLRHRRRGRPRHGPWRTLPRHVGLADHVGRLAGDKTLPAPGSLSGFAGCVTPGKSERENPLAIPRLVNGRTPRKLIGPVELTDFSAARRQRKRHPVIHPARRNRGSNGNNRAEQQGQGRP